MLGAALNTANKQPAAHAGEELERIVAQIKARWPDVRIIVRGDSGFCRDELMRMCEDNDLFYVFGLQKNQWLIAEIAEEMEQARAASRASGKEERVFKDFRYETRDSWSCERRVVGKAEYTTDKENPRFVVTNLPAERFDARGLYEDLYCARGDMENRIKEQQLGLYADRTSSHTLRANQLRLWISSMAYLIVAPALLRAVASACPNMHDCKIMLIVFCPFVQFDLARTIGAPLADAHLAVDRCGAGLPGLPHTSEVPPKGGVYPW